MNRVSAALDLARSVLESPRFVNACAVTMIGVAFLTDTLQRLIGWPGALGIIAVLVVVAVASLIWRRGTIDWQGVLPLSLMVFVGWAALSTVWSTYRWSTVAGVVYLLVFTALALYVGLLRDTIQIVRAFGDVLRFVLALSLALEILSGVLIDTPLTFLAIEGNLAELGPIQGVLSNRNQLGAVAIIAMITFAIELLTRSVGRGMALGSLVLAGACVVLARSPVGLGLALAVGIAALALYLVRRADESRRTFLLWSTLGLALVLAVLAWAFRTPIITLLSANSELTYRLELWRGLWGLIALNPLQGWGWIGQWRPDIAPFVLFSGERPPTSAVNAYIDVWFQLGLAGIFIFLGLVGLAFTRSWILAGRRRSIVFAWPALVLVALIVSSLAESSMLVEYGWLTFVVCCVKAARELSWRRAFQNPPEAEGMLPPVA